jgi:flagellar P-ring protein precursor FlgI
MKYFILILVIASVTWSARVKDVASLSGVRDAQLVGYGLVVGLDGSGDGTRTQFTVQSVVNMLKKMGIEVPSDRLRIKNVAAVMVTANLKPFVKEGSRIDIQVSSIGDARSLEGGTLLMTPLQAPNGDVYAVGQGALSVGGTSASGKKTRYKKNHVLSALIPSGAIVEKSLGVRLENNVLRWNLQSPDFSSANAMAEGINTLFPGIARAEDASTIEVNVPAQFQNNLMAFIAQAENVDFTISTSAKVVLNERTGTVVAGADVSLSSVAVSHGSITIEVGAQDSVSQPNAMSMGTTASVVQEQMNVEEEPANEVKVIPAVSNVGELAQALNTLGVAPRDIISIFQAIKQAGALHAELIVM